MNMLSLFVLFALSATPFEDVFFRNIKDKTVPQQLSLLQKRIKKDATSVSRITTKDNAVRYLELATNRVEKFQFLDSLVTSSPQEAFKSATVAGVYQYCQLQLAACMPHIQPYLECKHTKDCKANSAAAEILFIPENLDVIIKFKSTFSKVLEGEDFDLELVKNLYPHAINFGFLDSAEKMLKQNKAADADPSLSPYKCGYYFLRKEYSKATECSTAIKDPWSKLMTGYVVILKGEKLNLPEYEMLLNQLVDHNLPRPRFFAISMSGLLLKKLVKDVPDYDIDGLSKDYWNGYMLLAANKQHRFLRADFQKELEQKYLLNFANTLLVKIFQGVESNDILKQALGENSFLYQASK